jgi:hypothetical protein
MWEKVAPFSLSRYRAFSEKTIKKFCLGMNRKLTLVSAGGEWCLWCRVTESIKCDSILTVLSSAPIAFKFHTEDKYFTTFLQSQLYVIISIKKFILKWMVTHRRREIAAKKLETNELWFIAEKKTSKKGFRKRKAVSISHQINHDKADARKGSTLFSLAISCFFRKTIKKVLSWNESENSHSFPLGWMMSLLSCHGIDKVRKHTYRYSPCAYRFRVSNVDKYFKTFRKSQL